MARLDISGINLNPSGSHFFHLYKNEGKVKDYKERMRSDVEGSRLKKRQCNFDLNRALDISIEEVKATSNCFYQKSSRSKNKWSSLMMLAEWFMLIPEAFYDNFCMKFCPLGKHVLLVSQKQATTIYNKSGTVLTSFKSSLPGGGITSESNCSSVFDCIYQKDSRTIYFLDVIYYMKQDFREMAAVDRFNWLDNYMKSDAKSSSKHTFQVLSPVDCARNSLINVFQNEAPNMKLDGLLFYRKNGAYVSGSTYCSMWLKPYMVPELFDIGVHQDYVVNMPMDYATYRDDIIQYNAKYGWKEKRRVPRKPKEMELN